MLVATPQAGAVFCKIEQFDAPDSSMTLFALRDGVRMGSAQCHVEYRGDLTVGFIDRLTDLVSSDVPFGRGIIGGIGSDLIEEAIIRLRAKGVTVFVADMSGDLAPLSRKFEAMGFSTLKDRLTSTAGLPAQNIPDLVEPFRGETYPAQTGPLVERERELLRVHNTNGG